MSLASQRRGDGGLLVRRRGHPRPGGGLAAHWRMPLAWIARDLMLPLVFAKAWTGHAIVWRGNAMNVEETMFSEAESSPARRFNLADCFNRVIALAPTASNAPKFR